MKSWLPWSRQVVEKGWVEAIDGIDTCVGSAKIPLFLNKLRRECCIYVLSHGDDGKECLTHHRLQLSGSNDSRMGLW